MVAPENLFMPATRFASGVCMNRPFVLLLVLVLDSPSWFRGQGRARERLGSCSQGAILESWLSMNLPPSPLPSLPMGERVGRGREGVVHGATRSRNNKLLPNKSHYVLVNIMSWQSCCGHFCEVMSWCAALRLLIVVRPSKVHQPIQPHAQV